jgi:hypothetical protein
MKNKNKNKSILKVVFNPDLYEMSFTSIIAEKKIETMPKPDFRLQTFKWLGKFFLS